MCVMKRFLLFVLINISLSVIAQNNSALLLNKSGGGSENILDPMDLPMSEAERNLRMFWLDANYIEKSYWFGFYYGNRWPNRYPKEDNPGSIGFSALELKSWKGKPVGLIKKELYLDDKNNTIFNNDNFTIFIVAKKTSKRSRIIRRLYNNNWAIADWEFDFTQRSNAHLNSDRYDTEYNLHVYRRSDGVLNYYINKEYVTGVSDNINYNSSGRYLVGKNKYYNPNTGMTEYPEIYLAEILILTHAISDYEREGIENFFKKKWNMD